MKIVDVCVGVGVDDVSAENDSRSYEPVFFEPAATLGRYSRDLPEGVMSSVAHLALLRRQRHTRKVPDLRRWLTSARAMRAAVATSFYGDFVRQHTRYLEVGYDADRAVAITALANPKAVRAAHPLPNVQMWLALLLQAALIDGAAQTQQGRARAILNRHARVLKTLAGPPQRRPM